MQAASRGDAGDCEQRQHEAAEAAGIEVAAQADAGAGAESQARQRDADRQDDVAVVLPVAANTTTLTMSRTAKTVVMVPRKRRWSKCRACSTNTSGGPLTPADIVSAPDSTPAAHVETRTGVTQVESTGDDDDGDEHGHSDDRAQQPVAGAQEHEQPDRQAEGGARQHPPGHSAIGVVATAPRLIAVRQRRQRERHDDRGVGVDDHRQQRHRGKPEAEPRRELHRGRQGDDQRHPERHAATLTRCRCSGASCPHAAAARVPRRAGRSASGASRLGR